MLVDKKEYNNRQQAYDIAKEYISYINDVFAGEVYIVVKQIHNRNKELIDFDILGSFVGKDFALREMEYLD